MTFRGTTTRKALILAVTMLVTAAIATTSWMALGMTGNSGPANLLPGQAVAKAKAVATTTNPAFTGLTNTPTAVSGKIMTLNEANLLRTNEALDPSTKMGQIGDELVWVIVFDGEVDGNKPGDTSSWEYTQMMLVLKADTGNTLFGFAQPSGHEVSKTNLDDLTEHYANQ